MDEKYPSSTSPDQGTAQEAAKDVASRGARLAGEAKDKAWDAAEGGREQIAEKLDDLAGAVHRSGEALEHDQEWLAGFVERGADELGSLAATVRSNDLRGLLGKLQSLARNQPVLFAGAAMAAGFASARLGKAAMAAGEESGDGHE
jgi:hypothetical protein